SPGAGLAGEEAQIAAAEALDVRTPTRAGRGEDGHRRRPSGGEDDVVAVAALVVDLEERPARPESGPLGQAVERALYRVGAVVVDDRELLADRGLEAGHDVEECPVQIGGADDVDLVVARPRLRTVELRYQHQAPDGREPINGHRTRTVAGFTRRQQKRRRTRDAHSGTQPADVALARQDAAV